MKKVIFNLLALLMCAGFFSLTSCMDDDEALASRMYGRWSGEMESGYFEYFEGRGDVYVKSTVEVEFDFRKKFRATHGKGVETYYNPVSGIKMDEYWFEWQVMNEDILLNYDNGDKILIHNYIIENGIFRGNMVNPDTNEHVAGFYLHDVD